MSYQPSLLDWTPPQPSPAASEQGANLARVEGRIAEEILSWLKRRLDAGVPEFYAADLSAHVMRACGGSPESGMRVMRALRAAGQVQVELLSRSQSHYRVLG